MNVVEHGLHQGGVGGQEQVLGVRPAGARPHPDPATAATGAPSIRMWSVSGETLVSDPGCRHGAEAPPRRMPGRRPAEPARRRLARARTPGQAE